MFQAFSPGGKKSGLSKILTGIHLRISEIPEDYIKTKSIDIPPGIIFELSSVISPETPRDSKNFIQNSSMNFFWNLYRSPSGILQGISAGIPAVKSLEEQELIFIKFGK